LDGEDEAGAVGGEVEGAGAADGPEVCGRDGAGFAGGLGGGEEGGGGEESEETEQGEPEGRRDVERSHGEKLGGSGEEGERGEG
jgi:hypothetical protein